MALAACIMHEPQLLLLDEPTAGVDPKARREFWDQIHALAEEGLTVLVSTHYMDEAERCHRIAYIAYGHLLADGTVDEVIAGVKLSTWQVTGDHLATLRGRLVGLPGIEMVVPFGNTLHIVGRDAEALDRSLAPFRGDSAFAWQRAEPTLEDAFIRMMADAEQRL